MEALTAVAVAALTVYDMAKAIDKAMEISEITLVEKTKEPRVSTRRAAGAPDQARAPRQARAHGVRAAVRATSARCSRSSGWPGIADMAWITLAMVGARTLAMGLNRLVDAEIDARNPRTAVAGAPRRRAHRAQVLALCAGRARRSTSSPSGTSTRSCAGSGRSPWACSWSTRI